MGATYLPLSAVTDPRVTVYASRGDYIARNGGDPVNNQPPMFDPAQSVCMWSGPAGVYICPQAGQPNNVVTVNEGSVVTPNIPGPYNYPSALAPAPTNMTYSVPGGNSYPVQAAELCLQAQAIALAAGILQNTGVSLAVVEQPAPVLPTAGGLVQTAWNYDPSDPRRVWQLTGAVTTGTPSARTPVTFNAATLIAQSSIKGVGYPGTWAFSGTLLEWLPGVNSGLPGPQTPADLDTPIVLSPTQSVAAVPPTMVLMIVDTAGAGNGSGDSAMLQQIMTVIEQVHADVQKIGADLGDKTLA